MVWFLEFQDVGGLGLTWVLEGSWFGGFGGLRVLNIGTLRTSLGLGLGRFRGLRGCRFGAEVAGQNPKS